MGLAGCYFLESRATGRNSTIPPWPGADFPGGDERAQITEKILSQVVRHPEIAIGVVPIPAQPDKAVVVIRVAPGVWPLYQFQIGDDVRIPIRVQDTNRQATVRDIEQLFERRTSLAQSGQERLTAIESSSPVAPEFVASRDSTVRSRRMFMSRNCASRFSRISGSVCVKVSRSARQIAFSMQSRNVSQAWRRPRQQRTMVWRKKSRTGKTATNCHRHR
jgi:hypothetical protein